MNVDAYPLLVVNLLLFLLVGIGFILVHLLIGKIVRPARPETEKLTIYECGEPTIGSAWVQFDVRFYVVALLFVIFDVEVAFFFPWAVVFGHANELAQSDLPTERRIELVKELVPATNSRAKESLAHFEGEWRAVQPTPDQADQRASHLAGARELAWLAFWDIALFFGILLVGFAYLWKRGDLEWVRSVAAEKMAAAGLEPAAGEETLAGEKVTV